MAIGGASSSRTGLALAESCPSFISTAWANETLGAVTTSVIGGSESADSTKPGACTDDGGTEYVAASDRDKGLYIYKYTAPRP